jgi:hypothetical protein
MMTHSCLHDSGPSSLSSSWRIWPLIELGSASPIGTCSGQSSVTLMRSRSAAMFLPVDAYRCGSERR